MNNEDDIPSYLWCPVCFHPPEAKVFQCKEGHVICEKCYVKLQECPQCLTPYDPANPIRSRNWEEMLDEVINVECAFKSNGCQRKLRRGEIESHQIGCHFNCDKFGKLINLCKLLGFTQCDFQANNGNSKEAVEHLISEHGCISTNARKFKMELLGVKEIKPDYSDFINVWTPIVVNLEAVQCYLVITALLNQKDNSMAWICLFLPFSSNKNAKAEAGIKIEYKFGEECQSWSFLQNPINLEKAVHFLPNSIPWSVHCSKLQPYYTKDGSIVIEIKCFEDNAADNDDLGINNFQCKIAPLNVVGPVYWESDKGSFLVKSYYEVNRNECFRDRKKFLPFLTKLFGTDTDVEGISSEELTWLRKSAVFITAEFGDVAALKYLLDMKSDYPSAINVNMISTQFGTTPIFNTVLDTDTNSGVGKIQLLMQNGASLQILTNLQNSLLHWTVQNGSLECLKYLISLKSLDINAKNSNGRAPIHSAFLIKTGDKAAALEKAKFLLEEGVPLEVLGFKKRSLLHYAAQFSSEATEYFLNKGLDVNGKDEEGRTPLHLVASNGYNEEFIEKILRILLERGAKKDSVDLKGFRPVSFVNKSFKNVRKILG